jgi:hypothetical protein
MQLVRPLLMVLSLAACTDGRPEIVSATVTTSSEAPDELAAIAVRIRLDAVADKDITGVRIGLYDGPVFDDPPVLGLELALPPSFDPHLDGGESEVVDLENVGTTNADLGPQCGRALVLFLHLVGPGDSLVEFSEEPAKASVSRPTYLTVACS